MPDSSDTPKSTLNQLVIIGLGLIGASIASAASKRRLARKVIGISRRSPHQVERQMQGLSLKFVQLLNLV